MQKNFTIIKTDVQLNQAIEHINNYEYIAYDTETTGLNVRKDKIIGIAFSGEVGTGFYFPILTWNGTSLSLCSENSVQDASSLLNLLRDKKLIMHNASYDCRITYNDLKTDLVPALYCDTILLKHAVDEERPFGLKEIAKKIQKEIGLNIDKEANIEQIEMIESIKENGGSISKEKYELYKADTDKIGVYACSDVDITLRLFKYYSSLLTKEGLDSFFYNDETMPLLKHVTIPMESKGIPVDIEALNNAEVEIKKDIELLEKKIQESIHPFLEEFTEWYLGLKFPPRRSGSFAQALSLYAGLPLPPTASGRLSLSEESLKSLRSLSSFQEKVVNYLTGGELLSDDLVKTVQMSMLKESGCKYIFNLSSKHHLKKLFFEKLEEKPLNRTAKNNPQIDNYFLTTIKDKYEWVSDLLDYNKLIKIKGSYIDRFLSEQENGFFYPRFFQHRTISGRYGSDIQQLPRPLEPGQASNIVLKYNNKIRKFFIAQKGYIFCDSDFESLEPHVFAHVSKDDGLKDIFKKGHDFYSTIAIATEGLSGVSADKTAPNYLGVVDKSKRQNAKGYALGIPYGLEAFALSKTLNISQQKAEFLINQYLKAFPNLAKWMKDSEEFCVTKGRVKSEAGRVRHFPKAPKLWYSYGPSLLDSLALWKKYNENPKKYEQMKFLRKEMKNYLNNSKNFQIQSLAASITNRACIAISKELRRSGIDGYICAQVHDQIIVRVSEKDSERCKRMVQFLMENTYKISLKLRAPVQFAKDFYEGH